MLGALGPRAIREGVAEYWDGIAECTDPVSTVVNPATAAFVFALCARTDTAAWQRSRRGFDFFSYGIDVLTGDALEDEDGGCERRTVNRHLNRGLQRLLDGPGIAALPVDLAQEAIVGSPETFRERLRKLEETNVDLVVFVQNVGGIEHRHLLESAELIATEVLPEFRARHTLHEKWRAEKLASVDLPINSSI